MRHISIPKNLIDNSNKSVLGNKGQSYGRPGPQGLKGLPGEVGPSGKSMSKKQSA